MRHIFFLIGIFCYPFLLQAQWYPVPMPDPSNFNSMMFTDSLHGYLAVGDGSLFESSDGGISWHQVLTGTTTPLADIYLPTVSTGYCVGNNGVIVKTTNGGNTWPLINSPTTDMLRGVFFLNPDTGFICGQGEEIYRTANGGTTWVQQNFGSYWLRHFSFPTQQIGFCCGDGMTLFKTTDGGLTWNQLSGGWGSNLTGVQFLTVDTGFVCGYNGYVAKSFDGGLTWQVLNTGTTTNYESLWFINSQDGYCVGTPGIIMYTSDGGTTWIQETSGTTATLKRLWFITPYQGFICGFSGTLLENCLSPPGSITGPSAVCQGDTGKIYSINPVFGASGYNWSLPSGVIITSGSNTNIITVTYTSTSVSGSFSVYPFTFDCNGPISPSFSVTLNTLPLPTVNGTAQACFDSAFTYSTQTGMTNYTWNISSGGIITTGGTSTDNSVTVNWNTVGSQTVSVNYTNANGCTGAAPAVVNVTVNPLPVPNLAGPDSACVISTGNVYSTASGNTNYQWSISAGGTITSGGTTTDNTVTVTWNAPGTQHVYLNYTDTDGCHAGVPADYTVSAISSQVVNVTIAASSNNVCSGTPITFTATPTNSGTLPSYQWNINGVNVGINNPTYNYTPNNGDIVKCILTSNILCPSGNPATSNTITMTVNPNLPVSVSISASANPFCQGTSVIFTATPTNGGTTPSYQWEVNGTDVGPNNPVYTYSPNNGDIVTCVITSSIACPIGNPATSNNITMVETNNSLVSISINASGNPVCTGTSVTYAATPTNGGTTPVYQWKVNGIIVGTNSPVYIYSPSNGDIILCILTSNLFCVSGNPATSNAITMTVNPNLPVSIAINASTNPVCTGASVTFTATPTNGGTIPIYQWMVNGINVGTNNPIYSYDPINGDIVKCILTSNTICPTGNPATSNTIVMTVNPNLPVSISITASNNPVCAGISVTFTALPTNGGIGPVYQWKVNGINVGTNSTTFQYIPVNGDIINCILTSNVSCPVGNPATSNTVIMNISALPVVTYTLCNDSITTTNAQPFKLKGGIPLGGTYTGPGVNTSTGVFTPSLAGAGTKTLTYTYTNTALCSAVATHTISVVSAPVFICGNNITDVRDNKVYPTVQIGSQCWMAANLNYGSNIASSQDQRDNCHPEHYCYNDNLVNCNSNGGLYQWDELMNYDNTPAIQGLCSPGWHIPTEADWNTLFSNYINNAFAASPLLFSGFSGFNALLSGTRHINKSWDFQGFATSFWSSTSQGTNKAWSHGMNNADPSVSIYPAFRNNAFSVRCLKD